MANENMNTGARIRARRLFLEIKQAQLAQSVGISATYLNLIEHDRRKIGGKLLRSLAQALDVEPSQLSHVADSAILTELRKATQMVPNARNALEPVEDFAAQFPGWANLMAAGAHRIEGLEQRVAALSDRVMHDPHLAEALHEVISTVTSIRSSANILADTREIDPHWRDRFNRNIHEDATRLSQSAQSVVDYLGASSTKEITSAISALDQVNRFLREQNYDLHQIDTALEDDKAETAQAVIAQILEQANFSKESNGYFLLSAMLEQYAHDATQISVAQILKFTQKPTVADFFELQSHLNMPLDLLMRRVAYRPDTAEGQSFGYVSCDLTGGFFPRRDLDILPLPRNSGGCGLLPLYQALLQPMRPVVAQITSFDAPQQVIETVAIAQFTAPQKPNQPHALHAHMLYWAAPTAAKPDMAQVGVSCRICPATACNARRGAPATGLSWLGATREKTSAE